VRLAWFKLRGRGARKKKAPVASALKVLDYRRGRALYWGGGGGRAASECTWPLSLQEWVSNSARRRKAQGQAGEIRRL